MLLLQSTSVKRRVEEDEVGWNSLTVESDEIRECESEEQEVYEDELLDLESENLCLGDLGLLEEISRASVGE